jgi:hypothetical protein
VTAASVLIIDDGELDRVPAVLERMPIDWLRCAEPDSGVALERPNDLIISSGPRSMRMPPLAGSAQPLWICLYDQDFLPLRERLRDLGVHYLVSGELAPHAFELFVRQLLNRGQERRSVRRIPLQCDIQLAVQVSRSDPKASGVHQAGRDRSVARMLELSRESCVISARRALAPDQRIALWIPSEHVGGGDLEIAGRVVRAIPGSGHRDRETTAAIAFDTSDPRAFAHVQELLAGNVLGTQITPLREEPGAPCAGTAAESWLSYGFDSVEPDVERRKAPRQAWERRVEAICWQGDSEPRALLAKDLSATGLCVNAPFLLPLRSQIGLALYGRTREEPLFVRAEVVRSDGREVGLRFLALSPGQMSALERLLAASPSVEDLGVAESARHVVELSGHRS